VRCPSCRARNVDQAAWCTQCFGSLTEPTTWSDAVPEPVPADAPAAAGPTVHGPPPALVVASSRTSSSTQPDIRERAGEVEWRCRTCGDWTPLATSLCARCGTRRHGFGADSDAASERNIGFGAAVGSSLVCPGLGHLLAGAVGSGLARLLLWVLWAGAGLGSLGGARGGGRASAVILLVGAGVLWVTTVVDAASVASGTSRQLLEGRRLAVLVGVVTGGLILSAMITAFGVMS
jgi:hypothetical protein